MLLLSFAEPAPGMRPAAQPNDRRVRARIRTIRFVAVGLQQPGVIVAQQSGQFAMTPRQPPIEHDGRWGFMQALRNPLPAHSISEIYFA